MYGMVKSRQGNTLPLLKVTIFFEMIDKKCQYFKEKRILFLFEHQKTID